MRQCNQNEKQTIHQHGLAVAQKYQDLITGRHTGWKLPQWFLDHQEKLLCDQPDPETMWLYHEFHDISKCFCAETDTQGKLHFPNHASISAHIWRQIGGCELIAQLMQRDMDMHLLKPSTCSEYDAPHLIAALLLTALSELHANCEMFGGFESTSFKIKFKNLSKLGKQMLVQSTPFDAALYLASTCNSCTPLCMVHHSP